MRLDSQPFDELQECHGDNIQSEVIHLPQSHTSPFHRSDLFTLRNCPQAFGVPLDATSFLVVFLGSVPRNRTLPCTRLTFWSYPAASWAACWAASMLQGIVPYDSGIYSGWEVVHEMEGLKRRFLRADSEALFVLIRKVDLWQRVGSGSKRVLQTRNVWNTQKETSLTLSRKLTASRKY